MTSENNQVEEGAVVYLHSGFIGVVRWIGKASVFEDFLQSFNVLGKLPGSDDDFLGVKLSEGQGDTDGTFNNVRYFKCPPNKGLFVNVKELKKIISPEVCWKNSGLLYHFFVLF